MKRRTFNRLLGWVPIGLLTPLGLIHARTYLTVDEARLAIMGDQPVTAVAVTLSKAQTRSIATASSTRVRHNQLKVWTTAARDWFILDQVIGKHENIDLAVGIDSQGGVLGIEILVYRETYGHEIRNPKWLAQFLGKDHTLHLALDQQIKNISGATLSCRHVTDGVNRLTHTWDQVLRYLSP